MRNSPSGMGSAPIKPGSCDGLEVDDLALLEQIQSEYLYTNMYTYVIPCPVGNPWFSGYYAAHHKAKGFCMKKSKTMERSECVLQCYSLTWYKFCKGCIFISCYQMDAVDMTFQAHALPPEGSSGEDATRALLKLREWSTSGVLL